MARVSSRSQNKFLERYVECIDGSYTFGSYRLDAASRVLTCSGAVVTLAPKTFDLLVLLAESGGRLISKRELMETLWNGTFVEEANLSFQVSSLRKALGQEANTWIEAVSRSTDTDSRRRWSDRRLERARTRMLSRRRPWNERCSSNPLADSVY